MELRKNSNRSFLINQDFQIRDSMINSQSYRSFKINGTSLSIKDNKKGLIYALLAFITFGFTSFHIKLTKSYYPKEFDSNLFMLWRSISCMLYSYFITLYNKDKIFPVTRVKSKKWFYIRCYINYISVISLVLCMMHLRAATAACMSSLSPAIVIILSVFILNEKFHIRYAIGIIICFIGTSMIVLNEKKGIPDDVSFNEKSNILVGIFFGVSHIFFNALIAISQKILAVERIPVISVNFYVAFSNIICAIVYCILTLSFRFHVSFALFSSLNGLFFYYSCIFMNESLLNIELSKTTPISYVSTLIVFICGVLFIGEIIYLTDVLGSLLILSYNVYNSMYPHN